MRSQQEAFVVLLDLGLGERVEIGETADDGGSAFRTAKSLFATRPIFRKVDEAIRDVATPG
jgi:hypothetical protein